MAPSQKSRKQTTVTKPAFDVDIEVQYRSRNVSEAELIERVKEAWTAFGRDVRAIKKLRMYVVPEEDRVYYVINDTDEGSFFLFN